MHTPRTVGMPASPFDVRTRGMSSSREPTVTALEAVGEEDTHSIGTTSAATASKGIDGTSLSFISQPSSSSSSSGSNNNNIINNKPNLSLHFESSPTLSAGNGSPFWQQPYSELSRFPSASYRFRPGKDKEWPPEGAQYMTPLPSPSVGTRSRSTSDAASELSFASESGASTTSKPGGAAGGGPAPPSRTKTMQFFDSMDSALSPPPPPRITSADFEHRRKDWTPTASTSSFAALTSSPPKHTSNVLQTQSLSSLSGKQQAATTGSPPHSIDSPVSMQPMSNLPSSFRAELPPVNNHTANAGPSSHRRITSTGSATFAPSGLGKSNTIIESPLASPTESQQSRWMKDPPSRLPTLLHDPPQHSHPSQPSSAASTASTTHSRPSSLSISSLNLQETPSDKANAADITLAPAKEAEPGTILNNSFEVVQPLGLGAFSRVVLAKRLPQSLPDQDNAAATRRPHQRMPSGPYPTSLSKGGNIRASLQMLTTTSVPSEKPDDLVAVKLISRSHIKKNDRMRISIVREVEVLKHIRHPSLVHLKSSFDTPFHTCLVLEYAAGGELFDFIASHHEETSEALVRRIFGELADVLGWMHSIGLVHRDIKLENILLTVNPFASRSKSHTWPDPSSLPPIPTPLVKLTDFGLSRFVDLSTPYLETRCGSEEYAAPELIMGKRYDGRQTDSWALGVVLFALLVGYLPFVEDGGVGPHDQPGQVSPSSRGTTRSRKTYLLKIAKGEYHWPKAKIDVDGNLQQTDNTRMVNDQSKSLVGGLLTRDPKKRLRTEDIWDYEWMNGAGMPEKRFVRGGGLEGVALTAFERDDEATVRAEIPDPCS